jgi:hypothetical protein
MRKFNLILNIKERTKNDTKRYKTRLAALDTIEYSIIKLSSMVHGHVTLRIENKLNILILICLLVCFFFW